MSLGNGITFPVGASETYVRSKSEAVEELAAAGDRRREVAEEMLANTVVGAPAETRARVAAAIEALREDPDVLPLSPPILAEYVERTLTIQVRTGYGRDDFGRIMLSDAVVSVIGGGRSEHSRIVAESGRLFGLALWDVIRDALDMMSGDVVKPGG